MQLPVHPDSCTFLFDLLFQLVKQIIVEKLSDTDAESITELLQRYDARIFAFLIENTVNRGWRNTGYGGKRVYSYVAFFAKIQDALCDSFFCIQFASSSLRFIVVLVYQKPR